MGIELNENEISELLISKAFCFIPAPYVTALIEQPFAISLWVKTNSRKANSDFVINLHSDDRHLNIERKN